MKNLKQFNDNEWGTFYFHEATGEHNQGSESPEKPAEKGEKKEFTRKEVEALIKKAVKFSEKDVHKAIKGEFNGIKEGADNEKSQLTSLGLKIKKMIELGGKSSFDSKVDGQKSEKPETAYNDSLTQDELYKTFSDEKKGGIRDSSLLTDKQVRARFGKNNPYNIDFKGDKENLKNIGAGDMFPASVRSISVTDHKTGETKIAERKGLNGGFFYKNGEYAKIIKGTKVKVKLLADKDSIEKQKKEFTENFSKFKSQLEGKGSDIEINGKKVKSGELVAKMAARYDLDPNLLMQISGNITETDGKTFMNALNMTARKMQKNIMSLGGIENAYITKGGRRFLKPKYLKNFIGGNKNAIDNYLKSSGANYNGIKGPDGKVMKHEDVVKGLEKEVDLSKLSGDLSKTLTQEEDKSITEFLIGKMKGSTRANIKALSSPAKRMAYAVLSQPRFSEMYLSSSTRDEHHNKSVGGATGSDHQYGTGFDLNGKGKHQALAFLKQKYKGNIFAKVHGQGNHLHVSYRPNGVQVSRLGANKLAHKGHVRTSGYTDSQLTKVGVLKA